MLVEKPLTLPRAGIDLDANMDGAYSPSNIIKNSNFALRTYYLNGYPDKSPAADCLQKLTVPFLQTALNAIPLVGPQNSDAATYLDKFGTLQSPAFLKSIESQVEAINFSKLIFSRLPEYFSTDLIQNYSRSGALKPPSTTVELASRFGEMINVLSLISHEGLNPKDLLESRTGLMRTIAFFEVGSKMPHPSQQEVVFEA